jgi:hypothetical protein
VSVYIGSTRLGTISTRGSWTYRKLIWLPASTSLRAGTVKLLTTSSARVYIDGIAVKGA